jgi:hypothetical protein
MRCRKLASPLRRRGDQAHCDSIAPRFHCEQMNLYAVDGGYPGPGGEYTRSPLHVSTIRARSTN